MKGLRAITKLPKLCLGYQTAHRYTLGKLNSLEIIFFFFVFSRAAPMAHGDSQARGPVRAVAAAYAKATATGDLSHICDLHHSSWQIPDP